MKQVEIHNEKGIVIICGPTSCGKTSTARRLLRLHRGKGKYISYEKLKNSVPKKLGKEKQIVTFSKILAKEIEKVVANEKFAIIETPVIEEQQMFALIVAIKIYGFKDNITILKFNLPEERHLDYWARQRNSKPNKKVILQERALFKKEILEKNYKQDGVSVYTITDPNDVKFLFN